MYKFIFYFLILFTCSVTAGDKYFIYFKDKPVENNSKLFKNSPYYQNALTSISYKAIERRTKLLGDEVIDESDIPINTDYIESIEQLGVEIVWKLKWFNAVSCYINSDKLNEIRSLSFVDKVKPVGKFKLKREPDFVDSREHSTSILKTTELNYGQSLNQVQLSDVPVLHEYGITGKNVLIGLMDAGFRYAEHEALSHINVLATRDFVYGDDDVSNDNDVSHGTGVLGMVAGYKEGELISPAYDADFILAKTENIAVEVNLEEDNFAAGVQWLEAQGVDIISTSLGYNVFDSGENSYTYEQMDGKTAITTVALDMAYKKGVLTISSAGNEGNVSTWKYITSPADGFYTIAVGSVNSANDVASFSSRGPTADGRLKPEVMAMGVGCYSTGPSNMQYRTINGTSVSAPIVAGITAQLLSAFPYLNNAQMRQIIIESGDNVQTPDYDRGYGTVSAARAVSFPNISEEDGQFTINKMFLSISDIDLSSVSIVFLLSPDNIAITELENSNGVFGSPAEGFQSGDTVKFRYSYKDNSGNLHYDNPDKYYSFVYGQKNISLVAVDVINDPVPDNYILNQNYPNPFNPSTTIGFAIPEESHVMITIYNMLGEKVVTLLNEERSEGYYNDITWHGYDSHGRRVASGPYIYRLAAGSHNVVKKLVFIK